MSTTQSLPLTPPKISSQTTIQQLFDIQDEINKIKHYYEVQQDLTHTIAIILHCLNQQTTDPLHHNLHIPQKNYHQILNQNISVPAPLSLFLFQPTHQLEIHDHLIQEIKTRNIKTIDHFMDEMFYQIFQNPQLPPLFQKNPQYQTLENYLQPLFELYQNLIYLLKPKYD
jgi:hypothetical protein